MKFNTLVLLSFLLVTVSVSAQNTAPPDYLVNQDFPDSVKSVPLMTLAGEIVNFDQLLEEHHGKKLVIDFWASWCHECIVGLPDLNELMKKTKKGKVNYIFISIEEDNNKWKSAITKHGMQGAHYRMTSGWSNPLTNYISLDWVPRYVVIDKDGKIIMPKAVNTDNLEFTEKLLKSRRTAKN